jgi:hypothetical protein
MNLSSSSPEAKCSAYDAEFVAHARELAIPLVTAAGRLQKAFPDTAIPLDRFVLIRFFYSPVENRLLSFFLILVC